MKCTIPGPNVKVFGRAVHSLSKIGNELYIEPLNDGLAIRTVNSSRSAYACFTFSSSFFLQYVPTTITQNTQGEEEEAVRCKVTMKSCLTVFKSLSTLDKTVDKCKIHLDMKEARLVFQLHCKHGIVKTHNLSFIECETLQAVFTKNLMPNVLTAQSRLFMDAVVNFQNNQEEVSLSMDPHKVVIKNYVDDEPDPNKCIRSELALDPEEFDQYQVGIDTEVTFCLKELRAILAFSEPTNLPLSAHFQSAGKPIVFSITGDAGFQGDFVLATLAETSSQSSQQSTQGRNTTTQNISTAPTPRPTNQRRPNVPKASVKPTTKTPSIKPMAVHSNGHENARNKSTTNLPKPSTSRDFEEPTLVNGLNNANNNGHNESNNEDGEASPVIPPCNENSERKTKSFLEPMEDSDETDGEDMLPSTPPTKKFKSVFFGLSQATTSGSQQSQAAHQVLAEDTDEDD